MYKKLSVLYDEAIGDRKLWNYYDLPELYSYEELKDTEKCKSFIRNTLFYGGKDESFLYHCIDDLCPGRIRHIVSSFFLGIILYKNSELIKKHISSIFQRLDAENVFKNSDRKFSYSWMLICMFHDLGYAIEDGYSAKEEWESCIKLFPARQPGIPRTYTQKLIENYSRFCQCKFGIYEHGIYGGKIFYSQLCELRKEKSQHPDGKLYWGKEMVAFYALVSWVIMCHNIWIIDKNDKNVMSYQCHGLHSLIRQNGDYLIKLRYHPVLFLFNLIDTLDFSKLCRNTIDVWANEVKMEFLSNKFSVDMSDCPALDASKIIKMNNWLIKTIEKEHNVIEINF